MKQLLLFAIGCALLSFTSVSTDNPVDGIKIGDKAPAFILKNVDGKKYALMDVKDANGKAPKGYIIVFTCNTCPYAKANEQRLIDLHNTYAPMGYPVVAIQPNDPKPQTR